MHIVSLRQKKLLLFGKSGVAFVVQTDSTGPVVISIYNSKQNWNLFRSDFVQSQLQSYLNVLRAASGCWKVYTFASSSIVLIRLNLLLIHFESSEQQ